MVSLAPKVCQSNNYKDKLKVNRSEIESYFGFLFISFLLDIYTVIQGLDGRFTFLVS
jgi:hypothetical protein